MLAAWATLVALLLPPGPSQVLRHVPFERPAGLTGHASVYLPPGYEAGAQRYPLLILLHGLGGSDTDWLDPGQGNARALLDRAIRQGTLPPVVAVMPDGDNGYWVDWPGDAPERRYGALVEPDTRAWAEQTFRLDGRRAIGGISMGGFGALSIALRHPHTWPTVVSLSGALFRDHPTDRITYLRAFGPPGPGQHRFVFHNPIDLAHLGRADDLSLWLDCGRDDLPKFVDGAKALSATLTARDVPHTLKLRSGKHTWAVWRRGLQDALPWLAGRLGPSP